MFLILFLLLFAAAVPATAEVPTPKSHFGHEIGADRTVLDWERVVSYFRLLEQNSPRVRVQELGKTTEGRPLIAAFISAPETLKNLDKYLEIQKKLADPRFTPPGELEALIDKGKTVVMITCSIHSTELASTGSAVEFAYRLITENKPHFHAILDNTILILVPSLNPDGVDIVTQWYRKTVGTPFEGTAPPTLYHKYVGHDNNRDWYIHSQAETKLVIGKLHNVWHPQIVYDIHQQQQNASRIMAPPWLDPIEPNVERDPGAGDESDRDGNRDGPHRGRQAGRLDPRFLRFLDAVAALPGFSWRDAHSDGIGERAPGESGRDSSRGFAGELTRL